MFVNRRKSTGNPVEEKCYEGLYTDAECKRLYSGKPFEGHKNNFHRCIREGGLPVSGGYRHVQTMNTCHLCAIAARLKRVIRWDPKAERIVGDEQAALFFSREQRKGFEIPRV
ncbi:MAG TPA: hypothetical protein EYP14_05555 [Planctomycetaceae bacterium]|nr:hypothetical protein [Planctomycetaceae bacterium]